MAKHIYVREADQWRCLADGDTIAAQPISPGEVQLGLSPLGLSKLGG